MHSDITDYAKFSSTNKPIAKTGELSCFHPDTERFASLRNSGTSVQRLRFHYVNEMRVSWLSTDT